LEVIFRTEECNPPDDGVKVAVSVQFPDGGIVGVRLAQGAEPPAATVNIAASPLVIVIDVTTRSEAPAFDRVSSAGVELLPTATFPKFFPCGDREIDEPAPAELVPRTGHA